MHALHLMIDLETLSTRPNATVLSCGIHPFLLSMGDKCSVVQLPTDHYELYGAKGQQTRHVCPETEAWWSVQSGEAKEVLLQHQDEQALSGRLGGYSTLNYLQTLNSAYNLIYWGNGAAFDNVILKDFLRDMAAEPVSSKIWSHRADMCYRTMLATVKDRILPDKDKYIAHHALHDAKYQAEVLLRNIPLSTLNTIASNIYKG